MLICKNLWGLSSFRLEDPLGQTNEGKGPTLEHSSFSASWLWMQGGQLPQTHATLISLLCACFKSTKMDFPSMMHCILEMQDKATFFFLKLLLSRYFITSKAKQLI